MIDHSVYPDTEHGNDFEDDYGRADYVYRVRLSAERPHPAAEGSA